MLPLRLALRYARGRPARSVATFLGVLAGVAGLRAIELGTRGALGSVRGAFAAEAGPAALMVTAPGESNAPLPEGVLARLDADPELAAALPEVKVPTVRAEELNAWASPLLPGEVPGVLVLGVDFAREAGRARFRVSEGAAPADGASVLAGEAWARQRGLGPGATLRLVAGDGVATFRVAGLVAREGLGAKQYGQVLIAPIDAVRKAFGLPAGEVSEAALVLEDDGRAGEVQQRLARELGPGVAVLRPAERGRDVAQRLANMTVATDLASSLALFLAAFLIYGLYATAAAERRRDLGMLRCVGATRRQAAATLVLESVSLAVPGALAGALLGSWLARGVAAVVSRVAGAELTVPLDDVAGMLEVAALGVGVAAVSALWPAVRAARQDAFEAVRSRAASAEKPRALAAAGFGALGAGAAALFAVAPPDAVAPARTYALVLAILAGATGLLPLVIGPLASALSRAAAALFGGAAGLGAASPRWRPGRSGLAAGAVLGCVAMVGGISSLSTGMRREMGDWVDGALRFDLFARRPTGLEPAAVDAIRALPGVALASPATLRTAQVTLPGGKTAEVTLLGLDPAHEDPASIMYAPGVTGDVRDLADGGKAFSTTVTAERLGLTPGAVVTIATPRGPRKVTVVSEISEFTANGFALVVGDAMVRRDFGGRGADAVGVRAVKGVSVAGIEARIAAAVPGVKCERIDALKARVLGLVDVAMGSMDLLLWLSAVIGLLAVGASVAQGAIERRADIAALRALGMERGQVAAMLCAEAVVTALVGAALGLALGLYLGWIFTLSARTLGFLMPWVPPWRALLFATAGAVLAAVPAALFPAQRAARVPPAEALRAES